MSVCHELCRLATVIVLISTQARHKRWPHASKTGACFLVRCSHGVENSDVSHSWKGMSLPVSGAYRLMSPLVQGDELAGLETGKLIPLHEWAHQPVRA